MEWIEFTAMKKKIALYDATFVHLVEKAIACNDKIIAKEDQDIVPSKPDLVAAYKAYAALVEHLEPYIDHAKKHKHPALILLAPKNMKRYIKGGKVTEDLDLGVEKIEPLYKWAQKGCKLLKEFAPAAKVAKKAVKKVAKKTVKKAIKKTTKK